MTASRCHSVPRQDYRAPVASCAVRETATRDCSKPTSSSDRASGLLQTAAALRRTRLLSSDRNTQIIRHPQNLVVRVYDHFQRLPIRLEIEIFTASLDAHDLLLIVAFGS